jgi:hypothetical protein
MFDELAGNDGLGDDLLEGVGAIALFIYGKDDKATRRRVTALTIEVAVEQRIPSFVLGGHRCSRKSWIVRRFEERREQAEADFATAEQAKVKARELPAKRRLTPPARTRVNTKENPASL